MLAIGLVIDYGITQGRCLLINRAESRKVSSEALRQSAARTGIASIRVYDDMGHLAQPVCNAQGKDHVRLAYLPGVVTLTLDAAKCDGCGMCAVACPHAVFAIEDGKSRIVDGDGCMECGACARNCPRRQSGPPRCRLRRRGSFGQAGGDGGCCVGSSTCAG